jgi:hypothetical protein
VQFHLFFKFVFLVQCKQIVPGDYGQNPSFSGMEVSRDLFYKGFGVHDQASAVQSPQLAAPQPLISHCNRCTWAAAALAKIACLQGERITLARVGVNLMLLVHFLIYSHHIATISHLPGHAERANLEHKPAQSRPYPH